MRWGQQHPARLFLRMNKVLSTGRLVLYPPQDSMRAKLPQSCPILCDPVDCSPPGSSVHGILQARILEWVAMPSSRGSSQPRDQTRISYVSCIGRRVHLPLAPPGKTSTSPFPSLLTACPIPTQDLTSCLEYFELQEFFLMLTFAGVGEGLPTSRTLSTLSMQKAGHALYWILRQPPA